MIYLDIEIQNKIMQQNQIATSDKLKHNSAEARSIPAELKHLSLTHTASISDKPINIVLDQQVTQGKQYDPMWLDLVLGK